MEFITVGVLILTWVVLTLVLPILSAVRAAAALREAMRLREQLAALSGQLAALREHVEAISRATATPADPYAPSTAATAAAGPVNDGQTVGGPVVEGETPGPPPLPTVEAASQATAGSGEGDAPAEPRPLTADAPTTPEAPRPTPSTPPVAPPVSLETRIGANWLLYVGIATLVLGASYFVKYAFENNWITPQMRVVLGLAGGVALVEAGRRFVRSGLPLYGQMLGGGGIVILYVAVYAAYDFYGLIGPATAFGALVAITAFAAWRADREQAQALALLAVVGGFATPFLVGGDARTPHGLFAYAALIVAGTLWLATRHAWPLLHLVTFVLTGLTVLAWVEERYSRAQWLSLELWITAFAALFVLAWRRVPRDHALAAQLTRAVLSLTPLIYHVASLGILWRQTAGLLVYFIAATAVGVSVAGHTRRSWVRLVTFVLVSVPAFAWLYPRPGHWDSAQLIALGAIYALHLAAQFRETAENDERPSPVEILLLHLNGLWIWSMLATLFAKLWLDRLGTMTFALAAWYGLLAWTTRGRNRETSLHLLALAGALVAAGVAFELDGGAVTMAWAIEGAAIVALALATGCGWLQVAGGALLATALVRLTQELLAPAAVATLPILNVRTLVTFVVVALVGLVAWRVRSDDQTPMVVPRGMLLAGLVVVASMLGLLWASAEVDHAFARAALDGQASLGAGAVTSANLGRDVALSTLWAGYALLLIAVGIRRDYAPLRILAILILGTTVIKVFLVDLSRFDRFYRILSTVGLGLLLLGSSYLYQRFVRRRD